MKHLNELIIERLKLNKNSKLQSNDPNDYVCVIPRNTDYDMVFKKYKKYLVERILDYHKGYCFVMPKKEALWIWNNMCDEYTSFYKIPETCDSIEQFCNLFKGNFFDEDNMERYDNVENNEFVIKENILERLKITKDSKIQSDKPNFFCIFVDNKYLNPKIKISIDPYIYYHFNLGDLPGIFRDVYIFYYDELMIKKIKEFFDESYYDEIVAFGLLPKEYDDKKKFKQFRDDLLNEKIDLDDIKEL